MFKKNQKLSKVSFIFQIRFIFIYINNSPKKLQKLQTIWTKTHLYIHTHIYINILFWKHTTFQYFYHTDQVDTVRTMHLLEKNFKNIYIYIFNRLIIIKKINRLEFCFSSKQNVYKKKETIQFVDDHYLFIKTYACSFV